MVQNSSDAISGQKFLHRQNRVSSRIIVVEKPLSSTTHLRLFSLQIFLQMPQNI